MRPRFTPLSMTLLPRVRPARCPKRQQQSTELMQQTQTLAASPFCDFYRLLSAFSVELGVAGPHPRQWSSPQLACGFRRLPRSFLAPAQNLLGSQTRARAVLEGLNPSRTAVPSSLNSCDNQISYPGNMDPNFYSFDEEALLDRLLTGLKRRPQEVVFLLGSALSMPIAKGLPGVPGAEAVISLIRQEFEEDTGQADRFDQALRNTNLNCYQEAFNYLQGRRGQ
jgi:hypothetical protein